MCGLIFAVGTIFGSGVVNFFAPQLAQTAYIVPVTIISAFGLGWWFGPRIGKRHKTWTSTEAMWRAALVYSGALACGVTGSIAVTGLMQAIRGDPFGGLLTLLTIIPYAPWGSILAILFASWLIAPLGIVTGRFIYARGDMDEELVQG